MVVVMYSSSSDEHTCLVPCMLIDGAHTSSQRDILEHPARLENQKSTRIGCSYWKIEFKRGDCVARHLIVRSYISSPTFNVVRGVTTS